MQSGAQTYPPAGEICATAIRTCPCCNSQPALNPLGPGGLAWIECFHCGLRTMPGLGSAVIAAWNRRSGGPAASGGRGTKGLHSARKCRSSRKNLRRASRIRAQKKLQRTLDHALGEFLELSRREAEKSGVIPGMDGWATNPGQHETGFDLPTAWPTPANSDGHQGHEPNSIAAATDTPLNSAQPSSDNNNVNAVAPPPAEPSVSCHDVLDDFEQFIGTNQASPNLIAFLRRHVRERGRKRETARMLLVKDDRRRLVFWLSLRGQAAEHLARISQQGAMPKDQARACLKWLTRTNARIRRRLNAI